MRHRHTHSPFRLAIVARQDSDGYVDALLGLARRLVGVAMITAISADGTDVRAFDEGHGPVILVIHPGLDDGRSWKKVAGRIAGRFRVVRIVRRHYRVDLPAASCYSMAREVEDVLALAKLLGEPIVVAGHSSGAVVALEALAAAPAAFDQRQWRHQVRAEGP